MGSQDGAPDLPRGTARAPTLAARTHPGPRLAARGNMAPAPPPRSPHHLKKVLLGRGAWADHLSSGLMSSARRQRVGFRRMASRSRPALGSRASAAVPRLTTGLSAGLLWESPARTLALSQRTHGQWQHPLPPSTPGAAVQEGRLPGAAQPRRSGHLDVLVGRGPALALLRLSGFPLKFDFTETRFSFLQC